jgi:hypothetical protein
MHGDGETRSREELQLGIFYACWYVNHHRHTGNCGNPFFSARPTCGGKWQAGRASKAEAHIRRPKRACRGLISRSRAPICDETYATDTALAGIVSV